ncbi:hypothetical protein K2173_011916 [Erythroxylum novogranatense]|uniref:Uncharacterized protein n=1 Tax=Erythroxylum novogranatense TaxID=1862640 RepID=A0AAV8TEC3_9ROSI|nr:hypothetical protein K2173_011916 [Erythroxylum novogranatense]
MDSFQDDSFQPSSTIHEKGAAVHDLLEEGWFFGKLVNSKPKMSRCYSDPSPNFAQGTSESNPFKEKPSSSSARKFSANLTRAPSLPPCIGREERIHEEERNSEISMLTTQLSDICIFNEKQNELSTCTKKKVLIQGKETQAPRDKKRKGQRSSRQNLLRTPSLPPCIGRELEELEGNEGDITMSRLIRQAMPNTWAIQPRNRAPNKRVEQSPSMPKYRPSRNTDMESFNASRPKETKQQLKRTTSMKMPRDLESDEVQGFRDLGFTFDKKDLDPRVMAILPGLQDKQSQDHGGQEEVRKPYAYLSESWYGQSCATPIPICSFKNAAQDMKTQLKFWARAVASNVR